MNAFADWLFRALLGWTGQAANSIWNAVVNSAGGISDFFSSYWLGVLLILIIGGTVLDYAVWFVRWRPYLVWRSWLHRRRRRRLQTDAARRLDQGQMDEQAQSALADWAAMPQDQSPVTNLYDTPPPQPTWQPQWPGQQAEHPPVWQEDPAVYTPPEGMQPLGPWADPQQGQNPYSASSNVPLWQSAPQDPVYMQRDPAAFTAPPGTLRQDAGIVRQQQEASLYPPSPDVMEAPDQPQGQGWPGLSFEQPLGYANGSTSGSVPPLEADAFENSLSPSGLAPDLYEQSWDTRPQEPPRSRRRRRSERTKQSGITRLISNLREQLADDDAHTMLDGLPSPVDQQDAFHEAVYPQNYRYQDPHENGGKPPAAPPNGHQ
jgi:hypothetical protein